MDEVAHQLASTFGTLSDNSQCSDASFRLFIIDCICLQHWWDRHAKKSTRSRRDMSSRVKDIVLSLVLCLNASFFSFFSWRIFTLSQVTSVNMVLWHIKHPRWTSTVNQIASIGQTLVFHDRAHIRRLTPSGSRLFDILFLQRGPDVLMAQRRDAREGLRTHVITRKRFSPKVGEEVSWCECVIERNEVMRNVIGEISEHDWEFLGWMIFEECRDEDLDTEGR